MEKVFVYEDGRKEVSILTYYPTKYQDSLNLTYEEIIVSQFILNFKNGHQPATILAAKIVAETINKHFKLEDGPIVLIPIPASNREDTEKRYQLFSYLVSKNCHVINGNGWVRNWQEKDKKHLAANHVVQNDSKRWFFNYKKLKNANVIAFDDIATTGATANEFSQKLAEAGANVIGLVFLASTHQIKEDKQKLKSIHL